MRDNRLRGECAAAPLELPLRFTLAAYRYAADAAICRFADAAFRCRFSPCYYAGRAQFHARVEARHADADIITEGVTRLFSPFKRRYADITLAAIAYVLMRHA